MAGTTISLSNNGIQGGAQPLTKSGSERQLHKEVGDLGKALQSNDAAAAQAAVTALKTAAPTQNGRTDFQNAVKALDESVKAGDLKSAREAFANLQQTQRRAAQQQPARQAQARQAPEPPPAPPPAAPTPSQNTQQIAQADQERQARQQAEQAFITRQELAASSAQARPPGQIGKNIDTTA